MGKIELDDKQKMELARLMARGKSKGEALVDMGLATKVEQVLDGKEDIPVRNARPKKERQPDQDKVALMKAFEEMVRNYEGVEVGDISNREIHFTYNGGTFTMTLTRNKGAK